MVMLIGFSLELPSIKELLVLTEFSWKDDKNKWHFEAHALKVL